MKKLNTKRILSMLITAVMLFSLFSQSLTLGVMAESYVASVTVGDTTTPYTSLSDALTAWKNGGTLKLLKNASYSGILNIRPMYGFTASDYVLDLNGKTLNLESIQVGKNGSPNALRVGPTLTLEDSGEGGTVNITGCNMIDYGGLMVLRGGTITGGNGTWGACFLLHIYGSLDMYDGVTLTGSTSNNFAGGVFVGSDSEFNMYGGLITGNSATNYGGGVVLSDNDGAVFNLYGGTISGNTAAKGNGVAVLTGSFNIKGNAILTDGVYLASNKKINIGTTLSETPIGVTLQSGTGVFTSGWSTYMSGKDPGKYFTSDATGYSVTLNSGEAQIVEGHIHDGVTFTEWTSTNSLPTAAGNYYLAADVTISSTWEAPNGVNLCLCGHGIKKTGSGCVIKVGEGRTLKLYDCDTTTEHRYSVASPATNGAGVATVNDALTSGYQTFKGGYITGGYLTGGYQYGAGINLEGNGATLYMYGGTIIGNRLTAGSTGGGGVCVQDWDKSGGFYMYGGTIIGNTSNYGGGVYVRCGKMELFGGNISKNVANGNIGGGVLVFGGNSSLIIHDGEISNNKAVHGGAVEASGDGTVVISGGSFTNNLATGKGGALTNQRTDGDTSPASFSISGSPVFSGNTAGGQANDIYLCNTAVLNLTAALTNTTKIGIKKASTTGTFTSGWSTYMTDSKGKVADPADYFVSENGNYVVKLVDSEAKIAPPHDHSWSYTADGNVITASCIGSGTCDLTSQTLTITAQGKTYDGSAVTAVVTKSANWDAYGLATPGDIVYSDNTNAGTYTASVTAGGKTASIEFTIAKKTLTVKADAKSKDYGEDDPAFTYTVEGLVGTDAMSGALTREAGQNAGNYAIALGTLTAGNNYTISYTGATFTINKINATVTITGHNSTADYDGSLQQVTGYDAVADTPLYDVTKDFTFSGKAIASRVYAGETGMELSAEQFANVNPNFETVTFIVADGHQTVLKVSATVTTEPQALELFDTGSTQALVVAGDADGGILYYALGASDGSAPADSAYSTAIPTAQAAGSYVVWYKVVADGNHWNVEPASLTVRIQNNDLVTLYGVLYESDGTTPIEGAFVSLSKGDRTVDRVTTDSDGAYRFAAPDGVYNLVAKSAGNTVTALVTVAGETERNLVMPEGKTDSYLKVKTDEESELAIVVGGLDREAQEIRASEGVSADQSVSLTMTVEQKTEETAANAEAITEAAKGTTFDFFAITLEKTVNSVTTALDTTKNVLEIIVPYERTDRQGLVVYSYHGDSVQTFLASESKAAGTFRVDKENKLIYIYSNQFSTYAIGYTPSYRVSTSLSLGSYTGNVTVTLTSQEDGSLFTLENVAFGDVVFENIPKGNYLMTLTWEDGATNTITMPLTVEPPETETEKTEAALAEDAISTLGESATNRRSPIPTAYLGELSQKSRRRMLGLLSL